MRLAKIYLMLRIILILFSFFLVMNAAKAAKKHVGVIAPKSSFTNEEERERIIDFAKDLGKDVKSNWYPREYKDKKLRSILKVNFNNIDQAIIKVSESSAVMSFDDSAQVALERSISSHYPHKDIQIEYVFNYKDANFFSKIPIISTLWRLPARLGAGYVADRLGLNEVIFIGI